MTGTSSFLSQSSRETLVAFVLVASNDALGTQWPSFISHYIDSLRDRLSEDHPHRVGLYFLLNLWSLSQVDPHYTSKPV